ncbi:MAG: alpha/beta hydrolase [Chloroflexi bacterium]|nr:MAG: alpha/beta hydrolase [Chloroflexota bacterium]
MATVRVNGVTLFYEEVGAGSETVVFSHGFLMDRTMFRAQIEALRGEYRCLAYDHRGHGRSEKTAVGYEMENLYADAVAFIETMACAPCHFVGMSTGGFVGLQLAIRRPDLLKSLTLIDTSADAEPKEGLGQYKLMANVVRFLGWWPVINRVMAILFADPNPKDPVRRTAVSEWKTRIQRNDRMATFRFGYGIWARESVYDQLGQIRTPTQIIVGEKDIPTPVSRSERMAAAIPGAQLAIIPDAGHTSPVEQPEQVTAVLRQFLASVTQTTT